MFRHPLTWLGIGLLVALAAIWDFSPEDLLRDPPVAEPQFPRAFMIGSETRRFNAEGELRYHMVSERADHFQHLPQRASDLDYSLIVQPDMTMYGDEGSAPWRLNAKMGRSDAEGERIRLWDQVHGWQEDDTGITELMTPELFIYPERQFAETDKTVKMRSPRGETDAVGMRVDLEADYIELLSEVRGTYEPYTRPSDRESQDQEP